MKNGFKYFLAACFGAYVMHNYLFRKAVEAAAKKTDDSKKPEEA